MPVQIDRPHSIGVASGGARRAILLAGASGVVGRAVPGRLRDFDVVCPVHRSPVCGPKVTSVPGDVARQSGQAKPSSQDQLVAPGARPLPDRRESRPLPDRRESLRNSVQYLAAQRGYAQTGTEKAA
jgi:hypothetical protein